MADSSAQHFYGSPDVAASYELGRTGRLFVKNLTAVIPVARAHNWLHNIPLYTLFDWLYNARLQQFSLSLLGSQVLDVACGTSYVYRALLADGWTGEVAGVDSSAAMLDEGRRQLSRMRGYSPCQHSAEGGLFRYQDALGRSVLDVSPPLNLIDNDTLDYLLAHRYVGDVARLPRERYASVTSFSGPFCFYAEDEQADLVRQVCDRARCVVSLQFKNASFAALDSSPRGTQRVAGAIEHILDNRILEGYSVLKAANFRPLKDTHAVRPGEPVRHEVGQFDYYPTTLRLVSRWLAHAGFRIVRVCSMGFISQIFYDLARHYYEGCADDQRRLEFLFRSLAAIDDYFCLETLAGDNLQVTAVRRNDFRPASRAYKPSGTFRDGYTVRREGG